MSGMRRVFATFVTIVAAAGLGWLSRAPYSQPGSEDGLLRLSWRLRGERIETCRARTQAELDALPVHMRTPEVCDATLVAYRLMVQIDDAPADSLRILPGGARGDRPIFVLHDMPMEAGPHRVRIRFEREGFDEASRTREQTGGLPPSLAIDTLLHATAGAIALVTIAPGARSFEVVSSSTR